MKQLMLTPKNYLGKTLDEATIIAESKGFIVRVTDLDGKIEMLTNEIRSDRANFRVYNNIVVDVQGG